MGLLEILKRSELTLEDAYDNFIHELHNDKKAECPCCGHVTRFYKRRIHHSMVEHLRLLASVQLRTKKAYVDYKSLHLGPVGDFHKLRYWGLIEERDGVNEFSQKRSGYWRVTPLGLTFLNGEVNIPEYVYVLKNQPKAFSAETVNVRDCLAKKFDRHEIDIIENDIPINGI